MESVQNVEAQKHSLKWVGARLVGAHGRELGRLYNESHTAAAHGYHPDDHDCLTLTGAMEW